MPGTNSSAEVAYAPTIAIPTMQVSRHSFNRDLRFAKRRSLDQAAAVEGLRRSVRTLGGAIARDGTAPSPRHSVRATQRPQSWSLQPESCRKPNTDAGYQRGAPGHTAPFSGPRPTSGPNLGAGSGTPAPTRKREIPQPCGIRRWRDPDSHRGHHDFQSCFLDARIRRICREMAGVRRCFFVPSFPGLCVRFPRVTADAAARRPFRREGMDDPRGDCWRLPLSHFWYATRRLSQPAQRNRERQLKSHSAYSAERGATVLRTKGATPSEWRPVALRRDRQDPGNGHSDSRTEVI